MVELGAGLLDGLIRVSLPKKLTFERRFKWLDWSSAELGTASGRGNGKGQDPSSPSSWRNEKKATASWTERAGVGGRGEVGLGGMGQVRAASYALGENPPSHLFSVNR